MKNKLFILLTISSFTTHSLAYSSFNLTDPNNIELAKKYPNHQIIDSTNFNDNQGKYSHFSLRGKNKKDDFHVFATIGIDRSKTKRIYIHTSSRCHEKEILDDLTLTTNNRKVRYSVNCNELSMKYLTPRTAAGRSYLLNEFKEKHIISILFDNAPVYIETEGFTYAWNNHEKIFLK